MAYDEFLADRIRTQLNGMSVFYDEKKMFGGITFMVDEKMCVGIVKEDLMIRIDPLEEETLKAIDGVREMDFNGRPMKGFLYVEPEAIDHDEELLYFITKALEYNPKAPKSVKKKDSQK